MILILTVITALLIDRVLGEPNRFHPLVGFGNAASVLEKRLNRKSQEPCQQLFLGGFAVAVLILPCVAAFTLLNSVATSSLNTICNVLLLYWAIGHQSLRQHALRVFDQCQAGNLTGSRQQLSMIVSRNTEELDQRQVVQATVETVLENGSDAVFAPLFWFCLIEALFGIGGVAVLVYRLSNTLDAMWGYRNARFNYFGRVAARLDDILNYLPARLVALSYALLGKTSLALRCWREQSPALKSPNAGPVMTAGAGSLNVRLGGPAYYHKVYTDKPYFGSDIAVAVTDITRSLKLIRNAIILWCSALVVSMLCFMMLEHNFFPMT